MAALKQNTQFLLNKIDPFIFKHFLFIYYSTFASIYYYQFHRYREIIKTISFSSLIIFLLLIVCAMFLMLLKHKISKDKVYNTIHFVYTSALYLLLSIFILISTIDFYLVLYFNQRLSSKTLFVIFETNYQEGKEFICMYSDVKLYILFLFIILPFFCKLIINKASLINPFLIRISKHIYIFIILMCMLIGIVKLKSVLNYSYNPLTIFLNAVRLYKTEIQGYQQIKDNLNTHMFHGKVHSRVTSDNNLFVLVIGESTNRNHMSLYGYYRKTTPKLDEMLPDLYVFNDVISPHSYTMSVLKEALTFKNYEASQKWYEYPTLINCFNEAGYKTYWISNQELYGIFANVASALASQAKVTIFNEYRKSHQAGHVFDADLLKFLNNILIKDDSKNKFIIIHLMGNHVDYAQRYPAAFQRFSFTSVKDYGRDFLTKGKKKIISEYDNAVLYNDYIVSEIIKRVKKENASSWVLYFSDHGEEVYDNRNFMGHEEDVGNRSMIEIPFILWLSDKYKRNYRVKVKEIKENVSNPYMTDDLIHTILDLSLLDYNLFEPERSVINSKYDKTRKRFYMGKDYDKVLKYDTSKYAISENLDKVWAHRVDSIGKLKKTAKIFSGVELDIVFTQVDDKIYFDVNHPPAESIHLSLDEYLKEACTLNKLKFWFDLKNLSVNNKYLALKHFRKLIEKYDLKDRVILESKNYQNLRFLSQNNIYTSYYLPYLKLEKMTYKEKKAKADELIDNAKHAQVKAISYPGYMYQYVKKYIFPQLHEIDMLTWFPSKRISNGHDVRFLKKILNDKDIKVVLVGYPTEYDR